MRWALPKFVFVTCFFHYLKLDLFVWLAQTALLALFSILLLFFMKNLHSLRIEYAHGGERVKRIFAIVYFFKTFVQLKICIKGTQIQPVDISLWLFVHYDITQYQSVCSTISSITSSLKMNAVVIATIVLATVCGVLSAPSSYGPCKNLITLFIEIVGQIFIDFRQLFIWIFLKYTNFFEFPMPHFNV